jgi:DNA-binding MarR family transcriptional regulator|tara:strand:- start:7369 stop:7752 length:384 start_codon:yes stop_codon:yes gene_type:complete
MSELPDWLEEAENNPHQISLFGTDPRNLSRTYDPQTSHEAAHSIDTTGLEQLVYETICEFGPQGTISDEVREALAHMNLSYSSVTARYAALKEKGLIELSGSRRPGKSGRGQNVMVATRWESRHEEG